MSATHPSKAAPATSPFQQALTDVLSGLLIGSISVLSAISLASLIFSAGLESFLPLGIGVMLVSNLIIRTVTALGSAFPMVIGNPQPEQAAILSIMAAAIALRLGTTPDAILPTVLAAIALSSLATGLFLLVLSPLKLDKVIRFIPYPIVGGFLAGVGLLLVKGGVQFMLPSGGLASMLGSPIRWLPGLLLAGWLMFVAQRVRRPALIPVSVLGAIALFYGVMPLMQLTLSAAESQGLLLGPFPQDRYWQVLDGITIAQVNWSILGQQVGNIIMLATLSALSLILSAVGLEVVTDREVQLRRELATVGLANCLSSLVAGPAGSFSLKSTLLAWRMGGRRRLVGLTAAAVFALTLLAGVSVLDKMPRSVVGGVLMYLGLSLISEWLVTSRRSLPLADYFTILLIAGIIAIAGLMQGIGIGLVVAAFVFVLRYSQVATTRRISTGRRQRSNVERPSRQQRWLKQHGDQIYILELQGFLFFGTVNTLLELVRSRLRDRQLPALQFVVFDFRLVTGLDASALVVFKKLQQTANRHQLMLVFTALSEDLWRHIKPGINLDQSSPIEQFFDLDRGLEWCENQLLKASEQNSLPAETSSLMLSGLFNDEDDISLFLDYLQKVTLTAGSYLFRQGDRSDSLYFIASGRVNILREDRRTPPQRLRSLGQGAVFGEMGLYSQLPRSASVQAERNSCLYKLDHTALSRMETTDPILANKLHTFVIRSISAWLSHAKHDNSTMQQQHSEILTASSVLPANLAELADFPSADLPSADFPEYDEALNSDLMSGLADPPIE
ncbi:MAG: SulP family inorganic anion transporter [Cyanobacteria bacterium P01_D01_bin.14]